jgi:hypothetical protein
VTVNISGGGESAKAIVVHLTYLIRQECEIETDDGDQLQGKDTRRIWWKIGSRTSMRRNHGPDTAA